MSKHADIAVIGLGVMGANLARNFHSRGFTVAVHNRNPEVLDAFAAAYADERFLICRDYAALAAAFGEAPKRILLMVTAGSAVDKVQEALEPYLGSEDFLVDAGNTHFTDTDRRVARAKAKGYGFMGMGVSGGEQGALLGPAMMPGGDRSAYESLRPMLEAAAAVSDSGPCVTYCGEKSAGHFVKMVHNGIEYGDMQLIAETYGLLKAAGRGPSDIARTFTAWNQGPLASYLIEITAEVTAAKDERTGGPLVEQIVDSAGQKGTGRWTTQAAVELGVPLPTITAAVDGRALSSQGPQREAAHLAFGAPAGRPDVTEAELEAALYAAKIMSYTQGFELLKTASAERGYHTDLAAVARIWKAGCIIRARFLDRIHAAFTARPDLPLLFLDPTFAAELAERLPAWRKVVAEAAKAGVPVPALSASLAYFDTLRARPGTANLIQAQRDFFGAHTYRRLDAPEVVVHTDWATAPKLD